uniref:Uncharacterized protein n=1 Tax=Setaria viridis TaxID=4556 RepID=A0A4U6SUE7_SETVI|nr:hypothetical protein SEVIR_9G133950v2 [Setaria viridis]
MPHARSLASPPGYPICGEPATPRRNPTLGRSTRRKMRWTRTKTSGTPRGSPPQGRRRARAATPVLEGWGPATSSSACGTGIENAPSDKPSGLESWTRPRSSDTAQREGDRDGELHGRAAAASGGQKF